MKVSVMFNLRRFTNRSIILLSIIGCSQEPSFTVSDGIYIMQIQPAGTGRNDPARSGQEEIQLRIGKDGTIEFQDLLGRQQPTQGKITNNEVELHYRFEGMTMQGTGVVTGDDQMEGTFAAGFLDVGLNKSKEHRIQGNWSLIKKP